MNLGFLFCLSLLKIKSKTNDRREINDITEYSDDPTDNKNIEPGSYSIFISDQKTFAVSAGRFIVFHPFRNSKTISAVVSSGKAKQNILGSTKYYAVHFRTDGEITLDSDHGSSYLFMTVFDITKTGNGCDDYYVSVGNITVTSVSNGLSYNTSKAYNFEIKKDRQYCILYGFVPYTAIFNVEFNSAAKVTVFDTSGSKCAEKNMSHPVIVRTSMATADNTRFHNAIYFISSVKDKNYPYFSGLLSAAADSDYMYATIDSRSMYIVIVTCSILTSIVILAIVGAIYYMFFYNRVLFTNKSDSNEVKSIPTEQEEDKIVEDFIENSKIVYGYDNGSSVDIGDFSDDPKSNSSKVLKNNPYDDSEL